MAVLSKNTKTGLAFSAAILFFLLSWFGMKRGMESPWHERCVSFWKNGQWVELKTLAENLDRADKGSAETLYFGVLAAAQTRDTSGARELAHRLLTKHVLNVRIEVKIAELLEPSSAKDYISLFRTRAVLLLWIAIGILLALHLVRLARQAEPATGGAMLGWILFLGSAGITIMLI